MRIRLSVVVGYQGLILPLLSNTPILPFLVGLEFWRWTRKRTDVQYCCPHIGGGVASALRTTGESLMSLVRTAQRPLAALPER